MGLGTNFDASLFLVLCFELLRVSVLGFGFPLPSETIVLALTNCLPKMAPEVEGVVLILPCIL